MIVVTGGAGFIGSAFIAKLNSEGVRDILVVDEDTVRDTSKNLDNKAFLQFVNKNDFLERIQADKFPRPLRAIVHMGACSSTTEQNREYLRVNNLEYTKTLAEYATKKDLRFIYASSAATYGDGSQGFEDNERKLDLLKPLNPYGESKHLFDLWARDNGLLQKIVGLKFFNVYGPNEYHKGDMASVVWKAFNSIQTTGSFSLFKSYHPDYKDGEQKRDFVYVKDCCNVMSWFLQHPFTNGIFNVGSGKASSWNELIQAVFAAVSKPANIRYIEMPEALKGQYQYFSEAPMKKLASAGYTQPFSPLKRGVADYVKQHLLKSDKHW